jgi:hypothetical protein
MDALGSVAMKVAISEVNYLRCVVKVFRIWPLTIYARCMIKFWRKSKLQNCPNRKQSTTVLGALNNISVGRKLAAAFASVVILATVLNALRLCRDQSVIVAEASSAELGLLNARAADKNFQLRRQNTYVSDARSLVNDVTKTAEQRASVTEEYQADSGCERSICGVS